MNQLITNLANVNEKIKENFSDERLFAAIDHCLYQAAELLIEHTTLYEETLGLYFATPTRKKIASVDNATLMRLIYRFYHVKRRKKIGVLRQLKLNREMVTLPIQLTVEQCDAYCQALLAGDPQTFFIRRKLRVRKPSRDISLMLLQVKAYYLRYIGLRNAVVEKFYRYSVKDIYKNLQSHQMTGRVDAEDMAVEYMLSAIRSISKFDTGSGLLAPYLKHYFKHAYNTSVTLDEMGLAYQLNTNVRGQVARGETTLNNFSAGDIESQAEEMQQVLDPATLLENMDEQQVVRTFVESVDTLGLYGLNQELEIDLKPRILAGYRRAYQMVKNDSDQRLKKG